MEEIEQIAREFLIHDEEAYQLHHAGALGWFERVLKKTDIPKDRIKFAVKKEPVGRFDDYVVDLVVMPNRLGRLVSSGCFDHSHCQCPACRP